MSHSVAVIDIGSNSIKLLVAARGPAGAVLSHFMRTIDARISAGISHAHPQLGEDGMQRGLDAIQSLLQDAAAHGAREVRLVATSAVRDATNGDVFRERIRAATGHTVRVLTGEQEAQYIGRGLTCDPALHDLQDFYVFDLGGGSLECLQFEKRQLVQAASLQLGAVRLMEKFVSDPTRAFGRSPRYKVMQYVHDELVRGAFQFRLPVGATAIGTGGTVATLRAMIGAKQCVAFDQTDPFVPITQLRLLLTRLSRMTLDERKQVPGLPPGRADIFPTALTTLIVLADVAALNGYRHSLFNLRYGIADEAL